MVGASHSGQGKDEEEFTHVTGARLQCRLEPVGSDAFNAAVSWSSSSDPRRSNIYLVHI